MSSGTFGHVPSFPACWPRGAPVQSSPETTVLVSATARTPCGAHGIDFGLDLLLGHGFSFDCDYAIHRLEKFIRR